MGEKVYLSIPYTGLEERSFQIANEMTVELMLKGYIVFSPISHSHPLSKVGQLPGTWEFWERFDTAFIEWCDKVIVVDISKELIQKSRGVQAEIKIAEKLNKPIEYLIYYGKS